MMVLLLSPVIVVAFVMVIPGVFLVMIVWSMFFVVAVPGWFAARHIAAAAFAIPMVAMIVVRAAMHHHLTASVR